MISILIARLPGPYCTQGAGPRGLKHSAGLRRVRGALCASDRRSLLRHFLSGPPRCSQTPRKERFDLLFQGLTQVLPPLGPFPKPTPIPVLPSAQAPSSPSPTWNSLELTAPPSGIGGGRTQNANIPSRGVLRCQKPFALCPAPAVAHSAQRAGGAGCVCSGGGQPFHLPSGTHTSY